MRRWIVAGPYDPVVTEPPEYGVDDTLVRQLEDGPLHRFADYATLAGVIPGTGAVVYTIRDEDGGLVYADNGRKPKLRRVCMS